MNTYKRANKIIVRQSEPFDESRIRITCEACNPNARSGKSTIVFRNDKFLPNAPRPGDRIFSYEDTRGIHFALHRTPAHAAADMFGTIGRAVRGLLYHGK
ncbi:MAG: hypothetical protein LBO78_02215 [Rickettsiales bacterium]|jgi:hypothetical protein|nr:hypothetical protein [Rickettsiales bacterium]